MRSGRSVRVAIRNALTHTDSTYAPASTPESARSVGDDVAGVAVHIAARACSLADADEILATATSNTTTRSIRLARPRVLPR